MYESIQDKFPYIQAEDYEETRSIVEAFPHLKDVNAHIKWDQKENIAGMVIRFHSDDNFHKAVKYCIWTTSQKNIKKVEEMVSSHKETYFFFTCIKSYMYQGVARVVSKYINEDFPYWFNDFENKFRGYFKLEWVYLKDVLYKQFYQIYNEEGNQLTKSYDCDRLSEKQTKKVLNEFDYFHEKSWVFRDFSHLDRREKNYIRPAYKFKIQKMRQFLMMQSNYF